jgi:hypothetical protein
MPVREGSDRFGCGVHVGGLGVVVEVDAVHFGDEFQAMLDGLEAFDGGSRICGRKRPASARRKRQRARSPRCARL